MRAHKARVALASLVLAVLVFYAHGEAAAASSEAGAVGARHSAPKHKKRKHRAR